MKRIVFLSFILVIINFLTGCNKTEKLHCTKTENSSQNLGLEESLNITFQGNQVVHMSIYSEIEVSGNFVNYMEDFSDVLKEQYKNLEGKKGVEFTTNQLENKLLVNIEANLNQMDKEAKKELSIGSVRQSRKDTKKELEAEGYVCE